MKQMIIAIDGYSACGKSSTAKVVAHELGYRYIDSGAMYRAVTLFFHQQELDCNEPNDLTKALDNIHIEFQYNPVTNSSDTLLNGENVENEIRKMYISRKVSEISAISEIRALMVDQQRRMGLERAIVMDGRDIGTVVFPGAELKIFMTADFEVRAKRRQIELEDKGEKIPLESIRENLRKRDRLDATRKDSPLVKAADAIQIDTTHVTLQEQIDQVLNLATTKLVEINKEMA
jgi:cytidylate kinase